MEKTNICRTALGIAIQASKLLGRPYQYLKYTTLNEYYDILPDAHLDITTIPDLKYWAIGRGGHKTHLDNSDTPVFDPINHETTNTGPFKGVPFILRQLNDDLTAEQRANYALRRKENHNGIDYWAYYLKRLPVVNEPPEIIHDNTVDEITTSRTFQYTNDDLHPTPPTLPNQGVVVSSADIIRISSVVQVSFNEWDIREYMKVCKILYGSEQQSLISEILICSGVDRDVRVPTTGDASVPFREAIGVQVMTFVSIVILVANTNKQWVHEFELGEGEPLLTKGGVNTTRYSEAVKPSANAGTLAGTQYDASNRNNGQGVSTTRTINSGSQGSQP